MTRIAAALLIVIVVLAIDGGVAGHALAGEPAAKRPLPAAEVTQPVTVRNAKVLSLLLILEALRQSPFDIGTLRG